MGIIIINVFFTRFIHGLRRMWTWKYKYVLRVFQINTGQWINCDVCKTLRLWRPVQFSLVVAVFSIINVDSRLYCGNSKYIYPSYNFHIRCAQWAFFTNNDFAKCTIQCMYHIRLRFSNRPDLITRHICVVCETRAMLSMYLFSIKDFYRVDNWKNVKRVRDIHNVCI